MNFIFCVNYNNSTIDFLRIQRKLYTNKNNFDIIKAFKKYLSNKLVTYIRKPIEIKNIIYDEKKNKIIIDTKDKIHFQENDLDENGFYENKNIFEPPYDYKIYDNRIIINIELPGIISKFHAKLNPLRSNYVFIYTGIIKIPQIEKIKIINDNIIDGEFRLKITLPITIGTIKDSRPIYSIEPKSGVITLIYNLSNFKDYGDLINI